MTMPDSPISDAIANAFARFDATPRAFPEDMEELTKRVHFNPHLHPRLPDGRFAPKAGGKPHGDKLQPRGAKTKSKRFGSSRAAFAHALDHTQATGESMYVVQRRKRTKDHDPEWEVTPDKPPKGTPIEASYHKKPKVVTTPPPNVEGVKQRLAAEHGITTPEQLTTALALDNEHGQKIRDLVMGAGVDAPKPDPIREARAAQVANYERAGADLKDEEGNAIGNPQNWSAGHRVILRDGSYIGRDDEYPGALFIDEPGAGVRYDVHEDDIFEFARTKQ